jgi:hypothetical protein
MRQFNGSGRRVQSSNFRGYERFPVNPAEMGGLKFHLRSSHLGLCFPHEQKASCSLAGKKH